MKTVGVFVFVLAGALLLAVPLNYPFFLLFHEGVEPRMLSNTLAKLAAIPLVVWAAIRLGVGSWRAVGFNLPHRAFWKEVALGWVAGAAMMAVLMGVLLLVGVRFLKPVDLSFWESMGRAFISGLLGGLLVALVEEIFVRGVIYSAMRREAGILFSVLASSLYFASLHFIDPQPLLEGTEYGWLQGWQVLDGAFSAWLHPLAIADSFAALVLAGVLLALVRESRGNLAFVIGMHAGWIWVIKLGKTATYRDGTSWWNWGIGAYDEVTGWLSVIWVLVILAGWWLWRRVRQVAEKKTPPGVMRGEA